MNQIIEAYKDGRNIVVTGGAGVGKSYQLRKFLEWSEGENLNIARTALTGMASLQFDFGETVHRCFGIGFNNHKSQLPKIVQNYIFRTEKRFELEAIDVFIIDEVSMLRSDVFELLDALLKYVMNNKEPFGGKTVILSGDFMQLPPIVKPEEKAKLARPWAFQSPLWQELNLKVIYLTEIKRQDDPKFCLALNMVRAGAINEAVSDYFFETYKHTFEDDITPVKLLSTNFEVNNVNEKHLKKIDAPEEFYKAKVNGINDKLKDKLVRDCPAMEELKIKVGAQVMILINASNYQFVNGSMGEYLGKTKQFFLVGNEQVELECVRVKLFDSGETVAIPKNVWRNEKKENDKTIILASFEQFPIKLGWAITVHKSQGMTLDYLEVDLTRCFAEGMAYVALSRARNYEGLKVINWRAGAVRCNKDAFNFYMGLKNKGVI